MTFKTVFRRNKLSIMTLFEIMINAFLPFYVIAPNSKAQAAQERDFVISKNICPGLK